MFPGFVLSLLVLIGIFAPWIAPHGPTQASLLDRITPPTWYAEGSSKYILGADHQGRDVLSRLVYGARISLLVASTVIVAAGVLGTTLGMLAGYIGGMVDELIMRGVDVLLTLPLLLVALLFVIAFGQSIFLLVGLLAVFSWGSMVSEGRVYLTSAWWIAFFPGLAISLVVMSLYVTVQLGYETTWL